MSGSHTPSAYGPFSALTPSMWPQEILAKYTQKEESVEQPEFYYDEFGFRVDREEGADPSSGRLPTVSLMEDPPQRLRWQAHLEFTHNHDVGDLTWDKIATSLPRSEKLRSLVLAGIPHSMRPQLWMRLSGALQKKNNSELSYREIVKNSSNDETIAAKQIEKDLLRTMPSNACFANESSIGVPRLRRVLRALAWLYPEIGYCQGTGMVAAGREVERDFDSVYSRLVLCKTYRLDEDGKVLTPEELLYRAVQSVNVTHDAAHAQMDVKLRSLICVGLNEQVLHLWLEVLCSSLPTVEKWYQPWSFLRSPGWVQIKCELRVLCCFAFSLSQDWELPAKREEEKKPLKEGVQDMLVKHHLFSWDIDG
uniref:Small G protein signaling modulator 3 n=1 Tax=Molossus molossus TaxID=27622 RepID=A0A7J8G1A5_MOLMO|nr:small G protein signaling modulator 3 [Molossus molossus]